MPVTGAFASLFGSRTGANAPPPALRNRPPGLYPLSRSDDPTSNVSPTRAAAVIPSPVAPLTARLVHVSPPLSDNWMPVNGPDALAAFEIGPMPAMRLAALLG